MKAGYFWRDAGYLRAGKTIAIFTASLEAARWTDSSMLQDGDTETKHCPRPQRECPAKAREEAVLWTPSVTQSLQLVLTLHLIPLLLPPHRPHAAWPAAAVPHREPSGRLQSLLRSSTERIPGKDQHHCCSVQLGYCTGNRHPNHNPVQHGHSWFFSFSCPVAPAATSLWDGEGCCHVLPAFLRTSCLPAASSSTSLFHHQIQSYFCCNSPKSSRSLILTL